MDAESRSIRAWDGQKMIVSSHTTPRSGSPRNWLSSRMTSPSVSRRTSISPPAASYSRFLRISVVMIRIGAFGLSRRSPVMMPTDSGPKILENSVNFVFDRAFSGDVYTTVRSSYMARRVASTATYVLPLPVGTLTITSPRSSASTASTCQSSGTNVPRSGTPIPSRKEPRSAGFPVVESDTASTGTTGMAATASCSAW